MSVVIPHSQLDLSRSRRELNKALDNNLISEADLTSLRQWKENPGKWKK